MDFRYLLASANIHTFRDPFIGSAVNAAANQLFQVSQACQGHFDPGLSLSQLQRLSAHLREVHGQP
jgi:hypothetical protein